MRKAALADRLNPNKRNGAVLLCSDSGEEWRGSSVTSPTGEQHDSTYGHGPTFTSYGVRELRWATGPVCERVPRRASTAETEPVVWYEFQPGDRLPLLFAFLGMAEAGSNNLEMVVKRPFWIVVHQDGRVMFSFDNRSQQANPFSRWGLVVGDGERRGTLGLLMYVGPRNEAPPALAAH